MLPLFALAWSCNAYDDSLLTVRDGVQQGVSIDGSEHGGRSGGADLHVVSNPDRLITLPRRTSWVTSVEPREAAAGHAADGGGGAGTAGARASAAGGASNEGDVNLVQATTAGAGGYAATSGSGGARSKPPPLAAMCTEPSGKVWADTGHCYFRHQETLSWFVSRDLCSQASAHLATITSEAEQSFVGTLAGSAPSWIGFARFGAPTFTWVTSEAATYVNWEDGAPNIPGEGAALIRNGTLEWLDAPPASSHSSICEREPT